MTAADYTPSVEVDHLWKSYGDTTALADVSLEVPKNELFGFIGPDGAGKTTLFRILVSLLLPDQGSARVDGLDVVEDYRAIRTRVGYMPGRFSLYADLSVDENLQFFASVFGTTVAANYDLIRDIYRPLEPFKERRAGALSGGMKQKLALSCALIHRPRVLLLDEPTTGVDAVSRQEFWGMLHELRDSGITVLVSTPYMDEAAQCHRVALIQDGSILRIDEPSAVADTFPAVLFAVRARDRLAVLRALRAYRFARSAYAFGDSIHYADERTDVEASEIREYLADRGIREVDVRREAPTIEDAFMELMRTRD